MVNTLKSDSYSNFSTTEPTTILIASSTKSSNFPNFPKFPDFPDFPDYSKLRFKTISKLINWLESNTNKSIDKVSELDSIYLIILKFIVLSSLIYLLLQNMSPPLLMNKQKQIMKSKSLLVSMVLAFLVCCIE